ncbi:hypothetical protein [Actinomadura atramentaria]|uniref:hypothetical protein n=1 Tax=Actinomadura atramentaria TaxID=1990 RepID=UPI001969D423|nr:hypothetical protein [Actinomadura atramentaria]
MQIPTAGRGPVPYIAAWSSETTPPYRLVVRGNRIAYADENPLDRDRDGVLWVRTGNSPGRGRPEFGRVHHLRQRRAMRRLLCQVCAMPCGTDDGGPLWLLNDTEYTENPWPAPIVTAHPPICVPCARRAVRSCPHLRPGHVALRAERFALAGVHGILHTPDGRGRLAVEAASVGYGDRRLPWVRAAQLLVRLDEYTLVPVV